ncbi:hypothetical protein H6G80_32160 [Nostoc sp. FACHB-87]|uniref:hypothetical protein n=1 Tax=Nostocaceae TaxID=1162 RepID=UPI001684E482|nr:MULTISPECIES: hypothetical protein [Nostocaceae]MBD2458704.1 hypothetical protein [Nostoc sp. FACHB-87]MBD2478178.1 hypothetical protein [Anabaena sp. FACHB-83]
MVTVVVIINTLISLLLFYVAWQIWQIKGRIAWITDRLTAYEQCSQNLLSQAPQNLDISQQNIRNLRLGNQSLQLQLQQVRQIVSLLLLGQRLSKRYIRQSHSFGRTKTVPKTRINNSNLSR